MFVIGDVGLRPDDGLGVRFGSRLSVLTKHLFQQSLIIWMEMRDRGTLSKVDANKPDEIGLEIAKCDAALK